MNSQQLMNLECVIFYNDLLFKLLDSQCRQPLQNFCPTFISVTYAYSFRHVSDDNLALQRLTKDNSLDLFINSFLGTIPLIWSSIPFPLRERGTTEGWTALCHLFQRHITNT